MPPSAVLGVPYPMWSALAFVICAVALAALASCAGRDLSSRSRPPCRSTPQAAPADIAATCRDSVPARLAQGPGDADPACSATSTSPKRRCRTRSAPPSSNGRATASPPTRCRGSSPPAASRRSTASAGAPASTRSTGDVADRRRGDSPTAPRRWDEGEEIADDPLRLIFTCCHPSLSADAQVALTLREVCGPDDRGDRQRLPGAAGDARPAHRPGQGEDPRRAHSVQGAGRGELGALARQRAARHLPGLQRRLFGIVGRRR